METSAEKQEGCLVCKLQGIKCPENCDLAPYFPSDKHLLYNVSRMIGLLNQEIQQLQNDDPNKVITYTSTLPEKYLVYGSCPDILRYQHLINKVSTEIHYFESLVATIEKRQQNYFVALFEKQHQQNHSLSDIISQLEQQQQQQCNVAADLEDATFIDSMPMHHVGADLEVATFIDSMPMHHVGADLENATFIDSMQMHHVGADLENATFIDSMQMHHVGADLENATFIDSMQMHHFGAEWEDASFIIDSMPMNQGAQSLQELDAKIMMNNVCPNLLDERFMHSVPMHGVRSLEELDAITMNNNNVAAIDFGVDLDDRSFDMVLPMLQHEDSHQELLHIPYASDVTTNFNANNVVVDAKSSENIGTFAVQQEDHYDDNFDFDYEELFNFLNDSQ